MTPLPLSNERGRLVLWGARRHDRTLAFFTAAAVANGLIPGARIFAVASVEKDVYSVEMPTHYDPQLPLAWDSTMTGAHLPNSSDPNEWDRERLIRTVATQREMLSDRPDRSSAIYVSVAKGRARVLLPNGGMEIVGEGEGLHVWPDLYATRRETPAPSTQRDGEA